MANRGFPSMTALLGLLAIAGYQNRDKIAEIIKDISNKNQSGAAAGGPSSQPGGLGDLLGGASVGGLLNGGLGELLKQFEPERSERDGRFLGRKRTQQGNRAAGSETGARSRHSAVARARDRHERAGIAHAAVEGIAERGRQIHARGQDRRLSQTSSFRQQKPRRSGGVFRCSVRSADFAPLASRNREHKPRVGQMQHEFGVQNVRRLLRCHMCRATCRAAGQEARP